MGLLDDLKGAFGSAKSASDGVNDLKAKGEKLVGEHDDVINSVIDGAQKIIPGDAGDKVVDDLQDKLKEFGGDKPKQ